MNGVITLSSSRASFLQTQRPRMETYVNNRSNPLLVEGLLLTNEMVNLKSQGLAVLTLSSSRASFLQERK